MNRKQLTITVAMLEAGERAMALCRETGGHTPRTACHTIFQSMLAVSDWSPAIRVRPGDRPTPSRAAAHPLEWYKGKTIGAYAWYGFHSKTGEHYFRDDGDRWIRMKESDWSSANLDHNLAVGLHYVPTRTARAVMKIKHVARYPKQNRQRKGQFDIG